MVYRPSFKRRVARRGATARRGYRAAARFLRKARGIRKTVVPYGPRSISSRFIRPMGLNGGPMPMRFYTRFRYSERFNINNSGSASSLASARINLNSLFDPNNSGVGHQPRGFDELCPVFYQKYRVYGCRVSVEPLVTSTGTFGGRMLFGWQPITNTTTLVTTQEEARECIGSKVWTVSNNTRPPKFVKYFDCASVCGYPKSSYRGDDETAALYNQNPEILSRLHLFVGSPDDTTAVSAVLNVELTFYCVLFERDVVAAS